MDILRLMCFQLRSRRQKSPKHCYVVKNRYIIPIRLDLRRKEKHLTKLRRCLGRGKKRHEHKTFSTWLMSFLRTWTFQFVASVLSPVAKMLWKGKATYQALGRESRSVMPYAAKIRSDQFRKCVVHIRKWKQQPLLSRHMWSHLP